MFNLVHHLRNISTKQLLAILGTLWILTQIFYLKTFGIVTTGESTKYFEECQQLLQYGHFSDNKFQFYFVYIFIHIIFYKLGFEIIGVYVFQLLLNLLATYFFFELNYIITKKKFIAFIAVLLLLLTQPFEMWTVYLYTESVYSSLIILFAYSLFVPNHKKNWELILSILIFILILFTRPTGLLMIPVITIYFFFLLIKQKEYLKALLTVTIIGSIFFLLLDYAMHSSTTFDFMKPFLENEILCYIPTENTPAQTIHSGSNSILAILDYILQNKKQFLYISYQKFISFWGMQRTYDSKTHNLYFACFFYPIYVIGIMGLFSLFKKSKKIFLFIISLFLVFTLEVILTCDDWNNRFNIPIIPFIMMLGAVGINYFFEKYLKIFNDHKNI